jgi:hypothetical protein
MRAPMRSGLPFRVVVVVKISPVAWMRSEMMRKLEMRECS